MGKGDEQQQQRVMCQVDLQLVILVTKTQVFRLNLYIPLTSPSSKSLSCSLPFSHYLSRRLSLSSITQESHLILIRFRQFPTIFPSFLLKSFDSWQEWSGGGGLVPHFWGQPECHLTMPQSKSCVCLKCNFKAPRGMQINQKFHFPFAICCFVPHNGARTEHATRSTKHATRGYSTHQAAAPTAAALVVKFRSLNFNAKRIKF